MSHNVTDLMTANPFSLNVKSTLHDAHNLMKEKNVRHIPVIDEDGAFVGMLTQKNNGRQSHGDHGNVWC
jgi:CBS domain-containing protein